MQFRVLTHDRARAIAKIRSIGIVARRPLRPLLQQEARLAAISCAKATQPFGTGSEARDAGYKALSRDVYKVYATPSKAYADIGNKRQAAAFWAAVQHSQWDRAWAIIAKDGRNMRGMPQPIVFEGGFLHIAARDSETGRVSLKVPLALIRNPVQLAAYIKMLQESRVGFAKSAWSNMAKQLGGARGLRGTLPSGESDITANWITRKTGQGSIVWSGTDADPVITLTSLVSYGGRILPPRDRRIAIQIARDRLLKSLLIAVRAEMRASRLAA